jgi:hypothetical protein
VPNIVHAADTGDFYRGMELVVFNHDIIVEAFGRIASGVLTHNPELLIKRRIDEFHHYIGTLPATAPVEDGCQWIPVQGLRLKAGNRYWIAFKEGTVDTYASNVMTVNPLHRDEFRIKGNAIGAPRGEIIPLDPNFHWYAQWSVAGNYNKGQFINMRYRVADEPENLDLLFGRDAGAYTNAGAAAVINGGIRVATCATDGLEHTFTTVGNIYPWTWGGFLEKPRWVSRVEVDFFDTNFATEYEIHGTLNAFHGIASLMAKKFDNKASKVIFTFPKRLVNRIYVKSLKPDGPGQLGGGMVLNSVRAYS